MTFRIIQGDNRDVLKTIADNSIDSIVTDPPYGIDFLGKSWDANVGALETYQECLRVLKPGGHILAFSAARTYHHLAVTLEQAGFEIRDQIMWIYSSGFPKSQDIGRSIQRSLGVKKTKKQKGFNGFAHKNGTAFVEDWNRSEEKNPEVVCTDPEAIKWQGWGTALKPAHEPICLARKPTKLSIAKNVQKWGTGALNIDAARVPFNNTDNPNGMKRSTGSDADTFKNYNPEHRDNKDKPKTQKGPVYGAAIGGADPLNQRDEHQVYEPNELGRFPSNVLGDIPDYQKYFYCPKVSRAERHCGFDNILGIGKQLYDLGGYWILDDKPQPFSGSAPGKQAYLPGVGVVLVHGLQHEIEKLNKNLNLNPNVGNNHPTVKPVALMEYLITLVTPKGGHVLDPFNGSGSTGMAAVGLGYEYTGIELDPAYVKIAETRIQAWQNRDQAKNTFDDLFAE